MIATLFLVDLNQDDLSSQLGVVRMKAPPAVGSSLLLEGAIADAAHEKGLGDTFQVSQVSHRVGYKHTLDVYMVAMP